ncbi:MAG TPA: 4Fe-4S dicluster domain-containing protein, partial [Anaeromyxobacteraceae bacterium]|nr:4Fe-4S dicluster domain-containing protein [Anaeromyxobacteraceae bacterium]
GLCVRVCRDEIGVSAIAFAGRGQKRHVTAEFGKLSELCIGCGSCAAICPTQAIRLEDADGVRTIRMMDLPVARFTMVRCASCGAPFATRKLLDAVDERLRDQPPSDAGGDCPECRRVRHAAALAAELE